MIANRFVTHIKQQNWLAVMLDLLIVVVGIFLGLQVNNLNIERQANNELKAYLQDLATEVQNSIDMKQSHVVWQNKVRQGLQLTLTTLEGHQPNDDELQQIYFALTNASSPANFPDKREVLLEMQATGAMQLIKRGDLRSALSEVSSQYKQRQLYFQKELKQITAAPFSPIIVSYEMLSDKDSLKNSQIIVSKVDFEKAKQDPAFKLRVLQSFSLYTNIRNNNWHTIQMEKLILSQLHQQGYQPRDNWLKTNIDKILVAPSSDDLVSSNDLGVQ
ncbi:hypothetical protein E2K93_16605 [Thalassotalea sp. HSM 43]|uniref:hypothetical protein n=1 Tax=Thalassotalea sp. HSM 43 TaxID=2552945 RepID=UPI001082171E|nr:hypothetical protein [Thalassotalea sp. HSM 43]QBY05886.1 hypothetical protein E2K93_16605 [Thalassotalea sp. HSM 43]